MTTVSVNGSDLTSLAINSGSSDGPDSVPSAPRRLIQKAIGLNSFPTDRFHRNLKMIGDQAA